MSNAIQIISGDIIGARDAFNAVLVDRSISFEREAEFSIQILQQSDYALSVAMNNRQSVIDAVTNIAAIGLSLNPAKKQAYLVPRKGGICLAISYRGLIDLAVECGAISWAKAELVYSKDKFKLNDMDKPPTHERDPFGKDRGEVVGCYVVAKLHNGDYMTEAMSIEEINAIRDRSDAWKTWLSKQKKCPWVTDPGEMQKKTVVIRASKSWRGGNSERLDQAIHYLNNEGGEGNGEIGKAAVIEDKTFDLNGFITQAKAATTEADLTKVYAKAMQAALDASDKQGAITFKNAAMAHRETLRNQNTVDAGQAQSSQGGSDE